MGTDRTLLTDCYPLQLIGKANKHQHKKRGSGGFKSFRWCEICVNLCCKDVTLCSPWRTIGTAQIKCLQHNTQRKSSKKCCGQTCFLKLGDALLIPVFVFMANKNFWSKAALHIRTDYKSVGNWSPHI